MHKGNGRDRLREVRRRNNVKKEKQTIHLYRIPSPHAYDYPFSDFCHSRKDEVKMEKLQGKDGEEKLVNGEKS